MQTRRLRLCVEPLEVRAVPAAGLDWTFGKGGIVTRPSSDKFPSVVEATTDAQNRILVLESFQGGLAVIRLTPKGDFDTSFGEGGTARFQFDGKNPPPQPGVNVTPGTLSPFSPTAFEVDAKGRIVIGGTDYARSYRDGTESYFAVLRLNPDGTFDATFDGDGVCVPRFATPTAGYATSLAVTSAGTIVLAGSAPEPGASTRPLYDAAVIRLNDDGSPDTSFNGTGLKTLRFAYASSEVAFTSVGDVAVDGLGRVVLIDSLYSTARLTPDGQLDATFGNGGWIKPPFDPTVDNSRDYSTAASSKVIVNTSGAITVGGGIYGGSHVVSDAYSGQDAVIRLTTNGTYDTSFNGVGMWEADNYSLTFRGAAVDTSDRLVLSNGMYPYLGGYNAANIYRLNPDGSADESFGPGGHFTLPASGQFSLAPRQVGDEFNPTAAALQADGKILLVGVVDANAGRVLEIIRVDPNAPPHPKPRAMPVAVSAGTGSVKVYQTARTNDLAYTHDIIPFPGFAGPMRTATADFNNDKVDDLILASGPGAAVLRIVDGASGKDLLSGAVFAPYEPSYTGGLYVAAGDFDGDGVPEIVVSPDSVGGARVQIFSLVNGSLVQKDNFFGIDDPAFRGGCRMAVGDFNGDGTPDLAVGAGAGGGPRVALYDGRDLLHHHDTPVKLIADFFAFPNPNSLHGGVFVAAGDIYGDGVAELAVAPGDGGGPRVRLLKMNGESLADFFADDETLRGGARVAVKDTDGDGLAELIVGSGPGIPSKVQVYLRTGLPVSAGPDQTLDPFGLTLPDGVYVG
jgi:uncharacterized delta-60 repeat protein